MVSLVRTRALYAELAQTLGVAELTPGDDGGLTLKVGEADTVWLYGDADERLLVVAPVGPLPAEPGRAITAWLLRRNLFDSALQPFTVACDLDANVVLWGRVPLDQLDGPKLAHLAGALGAEAAKVRAEL